MTPWCQIGCTVSMKGLVPWLQAKFSKSSCLSIQEATRMKGVPTCGNTSRSSIKKKVGQPAEGWRNWLWKTLWNRKNRQSWIAKPMRWGTSVLCLNACVRQNACMKAHHTTKLCTKWLNIAATCTTALRMTIYKSLWKLEENSSASIWL